MGDRTLEIINHMVFEDLTNNVKAVITFSTYKSSGFFKVTETGRKDHLVGLIYKTKPIDPKQSFKTFYTKNSTEIKDLSQLDKEIVEKICDIEGSWLRNIKIGG